MKFGIQHPNFSFDGEGPKVVDSLRTLVVDAENLGYDSFWVMDHFHQIPYVGETPDPMLESWTTISVLAGSTSRIKLGTLVTGNVYRHPSLLAKIGATLDVLSQGRLFMGLGAAWNEQEAKAYGIPFPPTVERFRRLEEAVQVILKMWTEEPANFEGEYYQLRGAYCNPKPIQKPHPPIMVGGGGERETLRIVAKYADACNLFGGPDAIRRKLSVLREHCKAVGRDYDSILKTKLGVVAIGEEQVSLVRERFGGVPQDQLEEMVTYGNLDELKRRLEAVRDAGIEYFIASFLPGHESESVKLFADQAIKSI